MAQITASMVKELRERTQLPMMECKKALTEADGDIEKAEEILRKSGALAAEKKAGRETAEGRVATAISNCGKRGAVVEVRCETAPVANTEDFINMCKAIAEHIANVDALPENPDALMEQSLASDRSKTIRDLFNEVINKIRENMQVTRFARLEGGVFGTYEHHNGQVACIVQLECDEKLADNEQVQELARDLCMHITAINPMALSRDDMPKDVVETEKEIIRKQTEEQAKGKPANIIEKIMEGKLNKWFTERVLLEQPFVKEDKKSVKQVIEECSKAVGSPISIKAYLRYEVGGKSE